MDSGFYPNAPPVHLSDSVHARCACAAAYACATLSIRGERVSDRGGQAPELRRQLPGGDALFDLAQPDSSVVRDHVRIIINYLQVSHSKS
jgi:hypothetical protein